MESLGGHLRSVIINDVSGTTFYAQLDLVNADGRQVLVDCRPSDAIALAVRCGAPLFAEQSVLDVAGMPDFGAIEDQEHNQEMQDFHEFVEGLSPDDFNVTDGGDNTPQK
jgi:bifunctional DNase/RNase